ncbi:MAG: DUF1345 domain-containing protein [Methylococcaceae bacterium]|nr:DUF1345 domain-containing protein [Methylococcaceae bacterium]
MSAHHNLSALFPNLFTPIRTLLVIAVMLGVGSGFLLPDLWRLVTQVLVSWNIMVWSYLLLMGWIMLRANHTGMLKIASQEDEHGATILAMFSIANVASLAAMALELSAQELKTDFHLFNYLLTSATILGSWFFTGVLFTFHYSRIYYLSPSNSRPLKFRMMNNILIIGIFFTFLLPLQLLRKLPMCLS